MEATPEQHAADVAFWSDLFWNRYDPALREKRIREGTARYPQSNRATESSRAG